MYRIYRATVLAGIAMAMMMPAARAMSLEQAKAECRAQYGGKGGYQESQRTGRTIAENVKNCVQKAMKKKKKKR